MVRTTWEKKKQPNNQNMHMNFVGKRKHIHYCIVTADPIVFFLTHTMNLYSTTTENEESHLSFSS